MKCERRVEGVREARGNVKEATPHRIALSAIASIPEFKRGEDRTSLRIGAKRGGHSYVPCRQSARIPKLRSPRRYFAVYLRSRGTRVSGNSKGAQQRLTIVQSAPLPAPICSTEPGGGGGGSDESV